MFSCKPNYFNFSVKVHTERCTEHVLPGRYASIYSALSRHGNVLLFHSEWTDLAPRSFPLIWNQVLTIVALEAAYMWVYCRSRFVGETCQSNIPEMQKHANQIRLKSRNMPVDHSWNSKAFKLKTCGFI